MRRALIAFALVVSTLALAPLTRPRPVAEMVPGPASSAIIPPVSQKTRVFVEHSGSDATGRAFVSGLKRALRASPQFELADLEDSANLVVIVVSVSPAPTSGVASAVSLAYVVNNEWRSLLASAARFVGRDRAEAMGRETLAELTAILTAYAPAAGQ